MSGVDRAFDGDTYDAGEDYPRLNGQQRAVYQAMSDYRWHTLAELAAAAGASEASVSARIRDLRKSKHGGHTVLRQRIGGGLHAYRLVEQS